jgi:hypothetical protein
MGNSNPICPKRPSQNGYRKRVFKCGMGSAECGIQNAERNAPVFAPVITALRRGELLRRGKECGVRPNLISVIAQPRAPRPVK